MKNFIIYGANGYTGRLIAEKAVELGFKPVLAGRNAEEIKKIASELNLEFRIFSLENHLEIEKNIADFEILIHCAGPFVHTARPMALACIAKGVHYMDITGEIAVFELLQTLGPQAQKAAVMLLPGAGFDVVPSDCLAAMLKEKMPDAQKLEMAFTNIGGAISHGTAATAVENLGKPNLIRENGKLKEVAMGKHIKWLDFGTVKHHCVSIPWGDVSTAYVSTGIPNITVYMGMPKSALKWMKLGNWMKPLLKSNFVKNFLKKQLKKRPAGPNPEQRKNAKTLLWGEVSNAKGEKISMRMQTAEGYTLTALASMHIATKILNGNFKTGFQTPSLAYGSGLILELGAEVLG